MKRTSIFALILIFALSAGLNAASKKTNFIATANVSGNLVFNVVLSNFSVANTFNFGTIQPNGVPVLATNAGKPTYAHIVYNHNYPLWEIKAYTANKDADAVPRYIGAAPGLYGAVDDGTGLIVVSAGNTNAHSSPLKVWANALAPDGTFLSAPCPYFRGTAAGFFGVPKPSNKTGLYWKDTDLNGGGIGVITNVGWNEATAGYDVNGDGDTLDVIALKTVNSNYTGAGANNLVKVFEYSCWKPVTMDYVSVPGANTPIFINDVTAYGNISGSFNAYFAIADDVSGQLRTSKLIFELLTK